MEWFDSEGFMYYQTCRWVNSRSRTVLKFTFDYSSVQQRWSNRVCIPFCK